MIISTYNCLVNILARSTIRPSMPKKVFIVKTRTGKTCFVCVCVCNFLSSLLFVVVAPLLGRRCVLGGMVSTTDHNTIRESRTSHHQYRVPQASDLFSLAVDKVANNSETRTSARRVICDITLNDLFEENTIDQTCMNNKGLPRQVVFVDH